VEERERCYFRERKKKLQKKRTETRDDNVYYYFIVVVENLRGEVTKWREEAESLRRDTGKLRAQRDTLQDHLQRMHAAAAPATKVHSTARQTILLIPPTLISLSGVGAIIFTAACLMSTLLETGVGANDCECSRDQRLDVPSEARQTIQNCLIFRVDSQFYIIIIIISLLTA
jgi:hypothetical protein